MLDIGNLHASTQSSAMPPEFVVQRLLRTFSGWEERRFVDRDIGQGGARAYCPQVPERYVGPGAPQAQRIIAKDRLCDSRPLE